MTVLETKIQHMKIVSQLILSLFISAICPCCYNASDSSKKWDNRAEVRIKTPLLKAEGLFPTCGEHVIQKTVLSDSSMAETLRKKSLQLRNDINSAQKGEIIDLNELKLTSLAEKKGQDRKIDHAQHNDLQQRREVLQ